METSHRSSMPPGNQMIMIKDRLTDCQLYAYAKKAQFNVMERIYCKI